MTCTGYCAGPYVDPACPVHGAKMRDRPPRPHDRYREALERIVALADSADDSSHSMLGRTNAWANLGNQAIRIAREALHPEVAT